MIARADHIRQSLIVIPCTKPAMTRLGITIGVLVALAAAPTAGRADGGDGAVIVAAWLIPGSLEAGLLATSVLVAVESGLTVRREHPNPKWFTAAFVLGGINVTAAGILAGAVIDAAVKTQDHCYCYPRNAFDNGLNPYALAFSIVHVTIGIADIAMATWGLRHRWTPPVMPVPVMLTDGANRLAGGIGVRLVDFW